MDSWSTTLLRKVVGYLLRLPLLLVLAFVRHIVLMFIVERERMVRFKRCGGRSIMLLKVSDEYLDTFEIKRVVVNKLPFFRRCFYQTIRNWLSLVLAYHYHFRSISLREPMNSLNTWILKLRLNFEMIV